MSLLQEIEKHGLADCEFNRALNMTRYEMQYQIWTDLGYLEGKTDPQYQKHLWRLSDDELFKLWMNIHNAREAYKHETI